MRCGYERIYIEHCYHRQLKEDHLYEKNFLVSVVFVLVVVLCSGVVGCSSGFTNDDQGHLLDTSRELITTDASPTSNNPGDVDQSGKDSVDYTLMEQSGLHYIIFDSILEYQGDGQNELANLEFESLAEFKDSVTNGKLADWQKAIIATSFKKDKIGILTCDFNNLSEPQMPSECKIDGISWPGESYSFYISTSSEVFGFVHNYSQSQYNEIFDRDFESYFNKTTITVKETYDSDDGKNVTTYSTSVGDLMQIRYAYVNGNKTIVVDETYRLSTGNELLTTSNMVPTNITLYCVESDSYYVVDLFGFVEKPSDSWLYEFGMKTYVDLNIVKK